jgi:hypothetical protein
MGKRFLDQYSLLHWASGVVAYHWGVPPLHWFLAHAAFELVENTAAGMRFINNLVFWPGGKPRADSPRNIFGDNLSAMFGWFCAHFLGDTRTLK